MTSPLIYDTGTITLEHGSTAITGTGTDWAVAGVRGGVVTVEVAGGNPLVLDTVTDDTHAVAATKWMGPSGTFAYAISLVSADAADTVWASRHWSRVVGQALLAGIVPVASGTLAERDALDPQPANGAWFAYAEPPYDLTFYRKVAAGWEGPFAVRGPGGAAAALSSLTDLSDVTLTSPADGKALRYDGSQWVDAVLAADDIDDSTSDHKFASAGELAKLGDLPTAAELADALEDKADASALAAHVADDGNPHGVTKAQVGLGAVDNTADADKPLSTAMTSALAAKADAITRAGLASRWIGDELRAAAIDCRAQAAMVRDIYGEVPAVAGRPEDLMAFERLSGGSFIGRDGLMRFAASGEPRYGHDPVTLEPLGLMVERASTNLVLGPSLMGTPWGAQAGLVRSYNAATAPDGSMTATRVEVTTSGGYSWRSGTDYVAGQKYAAGFFLRQVTGAGVRPVLIRLHPDIFGGTYRDVIYNPATDAVTTQGSPEAAGLIKFPNGWRFPWVSHTATATVINTWSPLLWWTSHSVPDVLLDVWHAQIEVGDRPTSLIRNLITNAVSSRAADTVSVPVSSLPFNPTEGTILFEGDTTLAPPTTSAIIAGLSGQVRRALAALTINAGGVIQMSARDPSNQFGKTLGSVLPGERFRAAMSFDASGRRGSLNGAAVASSAGTVSFVPTKFQIGNNVVAGEDYNYRLDGSAGRVVYIPRAFSNGELQEWAGA